MKRNINKKNGMTYMAEKERAEIVAAVALLALSVVFYISIYSDFVSGASITGAATTGSGEVQVLVIDEVVAALSSGGGGGSGRVVSGICPESCTFGATRCFNDEVNICVPIFQYNNVCGVWMLIDCPGECVDGRCADCAPNWQPFPWSECSSEGIQYRTLVDYNNCYSDLPERVEYEACIPELSCSDGIQNQNEEGIDCGGSCKSCEYPVAVTPTDAVKAPKYVCGDGTCGTFELCWNDCTTKMAAIPGVLAVLLTLSYLVPFILMNMGGDYSLYYTLKKVVKKIESNSFTSGNGIFMTKVEPKFISFMARYASNKKLHRSIESLYSEAKMYLEAHEAQISSSVHDTKRMKEAMRNIKKLSSRFETEIPRSKKAYEMFKETAESLKSASGRKK
jgi:hypothetical protein